METPVLKLENIKKRFGKHEVLKGISLEVDKGKLMGLLGPSGCGKSTLLKILLGIHKKDYGKIYFNGKKVNDLKKFQKKIGYATQGNSFYEKLTVKENLRFFGKLYGIKGKELSKRIPEVAKITKIPLNVRAEKLSGGMKRRLDLGISLIHDPPFLILDEPTTGLDPLLREEIWSLIHSISRSGKTIIVASHMLKELEKFCDEIIIIEKGNTLAQENLSLFFKANPEWTLEQYFKWTIQNADDIIKHNMEKL